LPKGLAYVAALDDHPGNSKQIAKPGEYLMCRRFAFSMLTAIPLALAAGHAGAADIYVVGAGAIEEPFEQLTADFSRETGHKVHAIFGPVGGMQAKLKGGEKADVIVLSTAAMDELDKAGSLVAGSRAELGRAVAGIGVRAGAPQPDISSPDALKKTLQAARTVAYTNPAAGGTAGIYMTGLLDRLGLTEEIKKKELLEKSGSAVADAVANGAAEIGISFTSELLPNKGVKVVGTMPQSIGLVVTYVAGVATASTQAEAARALVAYMTRPAARDRFKEAGL
jgi:molybdate transport system substrate-binding protein